MSAQEGYIPFHGYNTWCCIVGEREEPQRHMQVLDGFLSRVEAGQR